MTTSASLVKQTVMLMRFATILWVTMSVNAVRRTRATAKSASTTSTVVRVTQMLIVSSRTENENVFAMMDTLAMDSAAHQLLV